MERNRIRYFIIAVIFIVLGYLSRTMDGIIWKEFSFVLLCAGSYFIFAIQFRKAASWVLIFINFIVQGGLQFLRACNFPFYNFIYDSDIGKFILGGPFNKDMFLFILLGTLGGAVFELALRQFNKVGMG